MRAFGVTGTREGIISHQHRWLLPVMRKFKDQGFILQHNGDCIHADYWMAWAWRRVQGLVELHPPLKKDGRAWFKGDFEHDPQDYGVRDQYIVDRSEMMVVMPRDMHEITRSGTWMTVRMARRKGIPRLIVWPDGRLEWEFGQEGFRL